MKAEKREKQQIVVNEIIGKLKEADLSVLVNYRGLTVEQLYELRGKLHQEGSKVKVYKNTLTKRAVDESKLVCPSGFFKEPIALVTSENDPVSVAKIIVDFAADNELFQIKGGFFEDRSIDLSTLDSLAKLPSRDVLIAKAVGAIKAPLSGLVMALSGPVRGLVYTLKAISDKKSGGE